MTDQTPFGEEVEQMTGETVVVDVKGPFMYIGTLDGVHANSLRLTEVDVHDTRETTTSHDLYLIQSLKTGVRCNRRAVYVLSKQIVSISRLSDIIRY